MEWPPSVEAFRIDHQGNVIQASSWVAINLDPREMILLFATHHGSVDPWQHHNPFEIGPRETMIFYL